MDVAHFIPWITVLAAASALPLLISSPRARKIAQVALAFLGLTVLILQAGSPPVWRLVASSLLFLYLMKGVVLLGSPLGSVKRTSAVAYGLFFTVWPGMAIEGLQRRRAVAEDDVRGFGRGLLFLYIGGGLVVADAVFLPRLGTLEAAWICVIGLLLAIHFGFSEILTAAVRYLGWPVGPLFRSPERSATVEEFWGRRWNLPFVEMDRRLFVRPLIRLFGARWATIATFGISGLFHEMAISYPAGAGYGLPFAYFAIQAAGNWAQQQGKLRGRIWTYALVLLPLPLLFHPAFLVRLPLGLVTWLHLLLAQQPFAWYASILLWTLGIVQLMPLGASVQVPTLLNWKEELARLSPLNRKLMWTYGAFVVLTIVSFAIITLATHNELMRGDRAAMAFATFAAVYWTFRLLCDMFYLTLPDWPKGPGFVMGHGLLCSLFTFLALGYGSVVVWHLIL